MKTLTILFFILILPSLGGAGGGLYAQIVNIPDPVFKQRLIDEGVDTNWDGEIQVSEAEAVTGMLDVHAMSSDYLIQDLTGIEAFINITGLSVQGNQLTALDLSNNLLLIELDCINNNLTYLNVENCINLEQISAYHNQLTSVDLSQNTNLKVVSLYNNQLTSIDLTSNVNLEQVFLEKNHLVNIDIRNSHNINIALFTSFNNPSLICIFVDNAEYSESAPGWWKDPASTYVETQAECDALGIEDLAFENLKIYPNPVKDILYIDIPNNHDSVEISILNIKGLQVLNNYISIKDTQIDISHFESGVYFLIVKDKLNRIVLTKKLIKL